MKLQEYLKELEGSALSREQFDKLLEDKGIEIEDAPTISIEDYISDLAGSPLTRDQFDSILKKNKIKVSKGEYDDYQYAVLNGFKGTRGEYTKKESLGFLSTAMSNHDKQSQKLDQKIEALDDKVKKVEKIKQDIERMPEGILSAVKAEVETIKLSQKEYNNKTIQNLGKKADKDHKHKKSDVSGLEDELKTINDKIEDRPDRDEIEGVLKDKFISKEQGYTKQETREYVSNRISRIQVSTGGGGGIRSINAGTGIEVTGDPFNPTITATGGGGGGAVDSVNGQTGVVVLDADDISDTSTTNKFTTAGEKTKLGYISVTQNVDLDTMESDIAGKVTGPGSSTDNALARFDSTTGKIIQNGVITESDNGDLANINSFTPDITPTSVPTGEGVMSWNSTEHTLDIQTGVDGVTLQVGREMHMLVRNNTGSTILNGRVVYVNGAGSGMPTIALAQANDYSKSSKVIGVSTMDISTASDGIIATMGYVHDLDTSGFTAGDVLYLSNSVSGGITNTNPTGLNYTIEIGMCMVSHATAGIINVNLKMLKAVESDEFKVVDSTDKTKQAAFNVSAITPGTRRVYDLPNQDVPLVGTITSQTLTNKSISFGTNTVTTTKSQLNTAVTDDDVMFLDSTDTVTGVKTFGTAGNVGKLKVAGTTSGSVTIDAPAVAGSAVITLPGVTSTLATLAGTETLTNKSISLGSNTVTMTAAQLNTAVTDNDVALINGGNNFGSEQVVQYGLYSSDEKTGAKVKIKNTTDGGDAILQLSSDDHDWGISARNGYAGNNLSIFSNFGGTPSEVIKIGGDGSLTVNGQNRTSGWTSFTPTFTWAGGTTSPSTTSNDWSYKQIGKTVFVRGWFFGSGGNRTSLEITVPVAANNTVRTLLTNWMSASGIDRMVFGRMFSGSINFSGFALPGGNVELYVNFAYEAS